MNIFTILDGHEKLDLYRSTDGLLVPCSPSVRHPPIKETLTTSVILSLLDTARDMKMS
jgi:hypothetical protein